MRVMFCGSGNFAVRTLRAVLTSEHELVGIITQPPRHAGRGGKLRPTAIAKTATELGLDVQTWDDINTDAALADIRGREPDVICVADYGQLVSKPIREAAPLEAFNLHGSLLPELRGAAPVNWAIIRGDTRTGVTTFAMVDRMDAGPIYAQEETDILPDETADQLRQRLSEIGAGLVCRTLDMLTSGQLQPRVQDESLATKAPRLKKADGIIDLSADAVTVRNLIRGTWPWPGAKAAFQRPNASPLQVTIAGATVQESTGNGEPGTLDGDLLVATGGGRLQIEQIKPAGKRLMAWRDFVNGYRVDQGDRFIRADL